MSSIAGYLTTQQKRGRQLYKKAISPSGNEIKAFLPEIKMETSASTMPCVDCHYHDGQGYDDDEVNATDITWENLTRPSPTKQPKGRQHPAYTESTLARAIRQGIDPAGNRLNSAMPRFRFSNDDITDLIAYLKIISTVPDPGLSETAINLATVLPVNGNRAQLSRAMQKIMEAYFSEINQSGGIFQRKIRLQVAEYSEVTDSPASVFNRLVEEEESFALVSGFMTAAESEITALVETAEIPLICPLTNFPEDAKALNRFTFYLLSGMREQARAMVLFSQRGLSDYENRLAVVYPDDKTHLEIVDVLEGQATASDSRLMDRIQYSDVNFEAVKIVHQLKKRQIENLIFLGTWGQLQRLLLAADHISWKPRIFALGSQEKKDVFDIPQSFSSKIFLSYPSLPRDHTVDGIKELGRLQKKYRLSNQHLSAQISAFSAAKILVEGLKRAGKKLSREKFVTALENMSDYDTGLTPRITYDSERRIGALGAYIVAVDIRKKEFVPVGDWIQLAYR